MNFAIIKIILSKIYDHSVLLISLKNYKDVNTKQFLIKFNNNYKYCKHNSTIYLFS